MNVVGRLLTVDAGKFLIPVDVTAKKISEPAAIISLAEAPP
jgi:hypothetical protein